MDEKELKCKLEELALGMGYEVKNKFKKEIDPIYSVLKTIIIFGFLTVFTIMGTYISINYMQNKSCEIPKNKTIIKEKIVYIQEDIIKRMEFTGTKVKHGKIYKYYRNKVGSTWEFYTIATPIKKGKPCQ